LVRAELGLLMQVGGCRYKRNNWKYAAPKGSEEDIASQGITMVTATH
jgi:hypothetical protein